jgi:BirA family biotin operon repressor/biotin-[acetyl-CoA-carboxylase] ligase
LAEAFDRGRFEALLATRRLGRPLVVRAETGSTNDDAWDALAAGAGEGFTVIAEAQTKGRGRLGRRWHTAPGRSLAMSLLLVRGCDAGALAATPLIAGLALRRALRRLGAAAELKWPNDLLLGGRKLAGVLVESRGAAAGGDRAVVVGVGVNVSQDPAAFPEDVRAVATSLAAHGCHARREDLAAAFLGEMEPLWDGLEAGGPAPALAAWRAECAMWGRAVTVATSTGTVGGVARDLDGEGRLVVETAAGGLVALAAGDVTLGAAAPAAAGDTASGDVARTAVGDGTTGAAASAAAGDRVPGDVARTAAGDGTRRAAPSAASGDRLPGAAAPAAARVSDGAGAERA